MLGVGSLIALHVLIAVGAIIVAAITAAVLLTGSVGAAALRRDEHDRALGMGMAAACMAVVATITAPTDQAGTRLLVVSMSLLPLIALDAGSDRWRRWRRPRGLPQVSALLLLGVGFGAWAAEAATDASTEAATAAITIVALAAMVDEAIHRGVLLDGLGRGPMAVAGAAAVSGAAAAGSHSPSLVGLAVVAGLTWGMVRIKTGSLWLPMAGSLIASLTAHLLLGG